MQYNTGLETHRLKTYQPLIKSLQVLSLKNRKLKKDTERVVTSPSYEKFKLRTLRPGFTKSPRPLHLEVQKTITTVGDRSARDDRTVFTENVVSYIDANKQERRQEKEVKDFIIKNVLNQGHLHVIKGLT